MFTEPLRRKTGATPFGVVLAVVLGVATSSARGHDQAAGGAPRRRHPPPTPCGSAGSQPRSKCCATVGASITSTRRTNTDLFFAQGYAAARDRLFQFEIWRRQATGTVAEILGPQGAEARHRHAPAHVPRRPEGRAELVSPARRGDRHGVRQRHQCLHRRGAGAADRTADRVPMLGILPERWTPAVVISRHNGLLGNLGQELNMARAVRAIGAAKVKDLVVVPRRRSRSRPSIPAIDAVAPVARHPRPLHGLPRADSLHADDVRRGVPRQRRRRSARRRSRPPVGARSEPAPGRHRQQQLGRRRQPDADRQAAADERPASGPGDAVPALLVAPGRAGLERDRRWRADAAGGLDRPQRVGAWGLTIFGTDGEDLYVYDTNPANPNQYRYRGGLGGDARGEGHHRRQGSRAGDRRPEVHAAWPGALRRQGAAQGLRAPRGVDGDRRAPYLASLRMNQARTWEEFREACTLQPHSRREHGLGRRHGNIGYQAVAITPIRPQLERSRAGAGRRPLRVGRLPADQARSHTS